MNWTLSVDGLTHGTYLLDMRRKSFYSDVICLEVWNIVIDGKRTAQPSRNVLLNYALRLNDARR